MPWTVGDKCSLLDKQDWLRWSNIYIKGRPLRNGDKIVGLLKWIKNSSSESGSAHWAIEARIRREDGIFPLEWQSPEWGKIKIPMSHKWIATSDKCLISPWEQFWKRFCSSTSECRIYSTSANYAWVLEQTPFPKLSPWWNCIPYSVELSETIGKRKHW